MDVRVNTTNCFIMKIPNKQEHQKIATNNASDFDFDEFKRLYRNFTAQTYSFLVIGTILPAKNVVGKGEKEGGGGCNNLTVFCSIQ